MKKRLLVLILIATLLFAMFALVACATSVVCTSHQWQPFEVVGNGDIKSEVCSKCGATRLLCYPFPHTWKDHVANDNLTHTSTCEVCGIEKALDHTFADGTPDVHTPMVCLDCGVQIAGEGFHQFVDKNENGICDVCASETICQHVYDEGVVTTPATCLATGEKKYTCTECGDVRTESIDMLAHNWTDWTSNDDGTHSRVCTNGDTHTETEDCVGEDATCLENSNCTVCGGVYQTAPGHIDEDEDGVCDVCDDMFNHRGDDECEHTNATIVTIPATCLAPGAIEYNCPDCGAVRIQPIEPLAHNWADWTCNADGTHSRVCTNDSTHIETADCYGGDATCTEDSYCDECGGVYQIATDHNWADWTSNADGTHSRICTNDGTHTETDDCYGGDATCTEDSYCDECGGVYQIATDHNWADWTSNADGTHSRVCINDDTHIETDDCYGGDATCTEDSYCDECGGVYQTATDHNWADWTSNADGTHSRVCINDDTHIETDDCYGGVATCAEKAMCELCCGTYGELLPHNYVLQADAENNFMSGEEVKCLASGYTQYICSNCGDEYYTDLTPADGHDVEIVTMIYPKCNETGEALVICNTCGVSYTMTLPCDTENGHSWVPDNENWYNSSEDSCHFSIVFNGYCEYCGIFDSYTLPPTLEHEMGVEYTQYPTCMEAGYVRYNCLRCHECGYEEPIPATGHVNTEIIVEEASCGSGGRKYEYCKDCQGTINLIEEYAPTGEHTWVTYEAQEPTCSEWGWSEYQECSVCYTTTEHEDYEPSWECVYDQQEVHEDYLVSPATCTSKAVYYTSCICGSCSWDETFEYGDEPVGHVDEDGNMVCEACGGSLCDTCVDDDFNYRCDVCDLSICTEHDWQFYLHDSNCTEDGYYYDYCYYCGDIRDYNIAEAWGHSYYCYYIEEVDATCTEEGWCTHYYSCDNCGDSYEETEVYPIIDHTYTSSTLPPTCSYMGHWQGTCDYCGYTDSYDIPMLDHVTEIVVIAPSCYADGCTREICTVCNQILNEYDVVPQYGAHVNENGDYNCDRCNASLCAPHSYQTAYNGTYHYSECIQCGAIDPSTITGHYDDTLDNTCDVCGACTHLFTTYTYDKLNHTVVCDICGFEHVSEHELVEKGTFEATCGMYGGIIYGCTDCDYTYTVKTADATGEHANFTYDYNEDLHWSICGDCGLIVSRAKHGYRIDDLVERDCYHNGCGYQYCPDENCDFACIIEYDHECMAPDNDGICADCGQCRYHGEWDDEDGDGLCDRCGKCIEHTYVFEETFEPTCGEVGKSKYNCSVCGLVLYKDYVLPTWAHNYYVLVVNEPTCNNEGYTIYKCRICGQYMFDDYVPATGEHVDVDNDYYCDNSDCKALLCDDHIDENSDIHCDKCGTSLCGDYHTYDDGTIHYDETHHWYVCATCGDRFEISEHEIYIMEELMPDCENGGIDIEGCYHCDYVRETYYDALGHRDDNDDYVCDNCWTSFCIINGEDHSYEVINDGSRHYFACTKCDDGTIWAHHIDENYDGVCDECGGSMDYVEECPHYNTNCYYNNEDEHLYICDDCNEVLYHESHNISDDDGWCWDCCEYVY